MKYVSPSTNETAFNCPHCGALAKQFWSIVYLDPRSQNNPLPTILREVDKEEMDFSVYKEEEIAMRVWVDKIVKGLPFVEKMTKYVSVNDLLCNVSLSKCFNCSDVSLWIHDKLIYPVAREAIPANIDMPEDVRRDYDEASSILNLSPRGAAALLRLCIQKLCKELGQPGKNINDDIKGLVMGGLDLRVQQALDTVRVIGNYAVHPGQIDLKDDRPTAEALFKLVNLIVEKTISEPKHVKEMYDSLPAGNLLSIEQRDAKGS